MQEILNQLGELVLGSVPTMIVFLFLIVAYNILVRKPLHKTLAERHLRTAGAMDEAKAAIGASEAKAAEYERRLREARAEIFEARQARLKTLSAERDQAVMETRQAAQQRIAAARAAVEASGNEAREQLRISAAQLSGKVLEAILRSKPSGEAVQA